MNQSITETMTLQILLGEFYEKLTLLRDIVEREVEFPEAPNKLNLPRLRAKDSCFTAPAYAGSSTGFIPPFQRHTDIPTAFKLSAALWSRCNFRPQLHVYSLILKGISFLL